MKRISSSLIHYYVHLFVLSLFVVGIVCSKLLMSMGILFGLLNLIIEGQYKVYFTNLKNNRFFVAALIFYMHDLHATILHALGLDHEKLTYPYAGRNFRLTDVAGRVVHDLFA